MQADELEYVICVGVLNYYRDGERRVKNWVCTNCDSNFPPCSVLGRLRHGRILVRGSKVGRVIYVR